MSAQTSTINNVATRPQGSLRRYLIPTAAEMLISALWMAGAGRYFLDHGRHSVLLFLAASCLLLPRVVVLGLRLARPSSERLPALWIYLLGLYLPEHLTGSAKIVMPHLLPLVLAIICLLAQTLHDHLNKTLIPYARHLHPAAWLAGIVTVYCLVVTALAIAKLHAFGYVGQDIGYFMQCLYTGLHGRLFSSNQYHDLLYTRTVSSDFASHNQPALFFLLPIYWLYPHAETLFVVRNICLALSAYPAYQLARYRLAPLPSALVTMSFLCAPAILFQNFYDYAPLSMVGPPLLFSLLFFYRRQYVPYLASLLLCLFVREDLVLLVFGMGVIAMLGRRERKWFVPPFAIGIVWTLFTWTILLPHFQQGAVSAVESCFSYLGASPGEMLRTMFLHPQMILTHKAIVYLKQMFSPFGLVLPFFSPVSVVSLPFILINLAGDPGCNAAIIFRHYSLIPFILLLPGTVFAVRWIGMRPSFRSLSQSLLAFTLLLASAGTTLLSFGDAELSWWNTAAWQTEARRVIETLPVTAAIAVPRYMLPLAANRDQVYQTLRLLDYHHPSAEFVVVDRDPRRMGVTSEWQNHYDELLTQLQDSTRFTAIYSSDNYTVYRLIGAPLASMRLEGAGK